MSEPTIPAQITAAVAADITALPCASPATVDVPCVRDITESGKKRICTVLYGQFGRGRPGSQPIVESGTESSAADAATGDPEEATPARTNQHHHADFLRTLAEQSDLFAQLAADWKSQLNRIVEVQRYLKNLAVRGSGQTRSADEEFSTATPPPTHGSEPVASGVE